jgi:hypothetical protein
MGMPPTPSPRRHPRPGGPRRVTALALAALLAWSTRSAAQQAPASVDGTLLDRTSRTPVDGARIAILGFSLTAASDSAGRFVLVGLPPGVRVLQVRALGYATGSWLLQLAEGQQLVGEFELERREVPVAGVTIVGAAERGWRTEAGFEQRRHEGRGFFITREDIRGRRANTLTDLLRVVPGVMTTCRSGTCVVYMGRSTSQCRPEYFLDGYPATLSTGPNFPINVVGIRGVEVYRDPSEAPSEFQRPGIRCGIIAIWTIEPGEDLDRHP